MYTFEPFFRYCSATRPKFSLKITTECHSVFSLRSPVPLSFQVSDVAIRRFTTGSPLPSRRTSGSRPKLPTRITLFTDPAIEVLHFISPERLRHQRRHTFSGRLHIPVPARTSPIVLHLFFRWCKGILRSGIGA